MLDVKKQVYGLLFGALLITNSWIWLHVKYGDDSLLEENHLVENIQVGLYAISALFLLANAFRVKGFECWLNLFFGVTCLSFTLREIDVETFNVAEVIIFLGSGKGRNVMFILVYLYLAMRFFRNYKSAILSHKSALKSPVVQLCVIGGVFLVLGAISDDVGLLMVEELSETNGAICIFMAALVFVFKPLSLMSCFDGKDETLR